MLHSLLDSWVARPFRALSNACKISLSSLLVTRLHLIKQNDELCVIYCNNEKITINT